MSFKSMIATGKQVFSEFMADEPFQLAGALAFYTLLSLAPLLLVVVGVAGLVFGEAAAEGQLVNQIDELVGQEGAEAVQMVLAEAAGPGRGVVSMVVGLVTLLLGATTVFAQLQSSLNRIWDVKMSPQASTVRTVLRTRLLSLGLVLAIGFLLLVSLVVSSVLVGLRTQLAEWFPGAAALWQGLDLVLSIGVITLLIAMIFKYLPDVEIAWRDVWVGALTTGVLFGIGKFLIGLYMGQAGIGSAYGAAGSLVVLLVWVYYSALILFLGAEITQVYSRRQGKGIEPASYAVPRSESEGS